MRKAILSLLMGAFLFVYSIAPAFAEFVFVTKSGKKYHHVESRYSQVEGAEKISLEEALKRGLKPSKDYLKRQANDDQEMTKK